MDEQEIQKRNEAVAKYLGVAVDYSEEDALYEVSHRNWCDASSLPYDHDWNYLMEVVETINKSGDDKDNFGVTITHNQAVVFQYRKGLHTQLFSSFSGSEPLINHVFKVVSDYCLNYGKKTN